MNSNEFLEIKNGLRDLGLEVEVYEKKRRGAFDSTTIVVISFVIGSFGGAIFKEAGKDTWIMIKNFMSRVLETSKKNGDELSAEMTMNLEDARNVVIFSPIESMDDVDAYIEVTKKATYKIENGQSVILKEEFGKIVVSRK